MATSLDTVGPGEPARNRRSAAVVAAPLVVGGAAGLAARIQGPTTDAYVRTRLWIACVVAGVVASAALAASAWVRARTAAARAAGAADERRAAAENHRRFLLRLDHELKNPITAIQAGVANLPAPTAASAISSQAERLGGLVSDLRKLAELETQPLARDPVDLAELLDEVRDVVGDLPEAGDRTITLSLPRAPWPLGTVPGDQDLLFLAVHNLVANAVKFTQPGDTVEIRARDDDAQVVVEVADTGVGIPDQEIPDIWDELARGSAARGTPGMGLGLALVRVVVARHGGRVWVRSRLGRGTVVGVSLPAG
jgi:two-component system OmpR family sensor kinase